MAEHRPATTSGIVDTAEHARVVNHLVATDHLESDKLRGLVPSDLFDIVARHGLHFDESRQVGIVFHMISCLTEHGRIGLTAVGDTAREADERYRAAQRVLPSRNPRFPSDTGTRPWVSGSGGSPPTGARVRSGS